MAKAATTKPKADEAAEKETGTDVAVVDPKSTALATTDDEVADFDYGEDAGGGFENQTSEDQSLPFLLVGQGNTPEVLEGKNNARLGSIINRTTGEVFDGKEGVTFIPALTSHVFVEWVPRDLGGGIVATYPLDHPLVAQVRREQPLGKYKMPGEPKIDPKTKLDMRNDLIETFYVYGAYLIDGQMYPAVLTHSSTHIKPYKNWMFKANAIIVALPNGRKVKPPLWAHRYKLTTEVVKKDNNTWAVPVYTFDGATATDCRIPTNSAVYQQLKAIKEAILSGQMRAATETLEREGGSVSSDETVVEGDKSSEAPPF